MPALCLSMVLLSAFATMTAQAVRMLLPRAPAVWCLVEPSGLVARISATPEGPELPHSATMSAKGARWAYYYPEPTLLTVVMARLGIGGTGTTLLLRTGRKTTKPSGRWCEFRRCGEEEFEAALASWRNGGG